MNTIIEKIRTEIERRKKQMVDASYPSVIRRTRISELSIVLDILDDIQERTDNAITFTLQEQPVCEDLKKRASEIYPNKEGDLCSLHSTLQRGGYIRGYQDCKEQMMKEAVEGVVVKDINNKLAVTAKNVNLDGFKFGEKVRIIIVKED